MDVAAPPPGAQSSILSDFNAQGSWYCNLNNYTVNGEVWAESDNPPPSTGGGAGGGGGSGPDASLFTTPWVLRLFGLPCYR